MGSLALDHLIYAVPVLDAGVEELYGSLGVRAVSGGRHEGLGTHNALVGLGDGAYLELMAPDPGQPDPPNRRFPWVSPTSPPRLATWALRTDDIDASVARALQAGFDPGPVVSMSRLRPDGVLLAWRMTPPAFTGDEIVPFLIDWGNAPHPSTTLTHGVALTSLRAEHPDPTAIATTFEALGAPVAVSAGDRPGLVASLASGGRTVVIR